MAGRGRGRGKSVSFDVQALGFGRGEALPAAIVQPPPVFPLQTFKPVQLLQSEDLEYILALKQEFVGTLRKSPFYIQAKEKKRDIERYSDKYQVTQQDSSKSLQPDWRRLPAELKIKEKRTTKLKTAVRPNISKKKQAITDQTDVEKTLESLEKKEEETVDVEEDKEKEDEEKEEEEEIEEGEVYDEDDLEEETDYAMAYFDNGEGYGDDDGDDDEGPVY